MWELRNHVMWALHIIWQNIDWQIFRILWEKASHRLVQLIDRLSMIHSEIQLRRIMEFYNEIMINLELNRINVEFSSFGSKEFFTPTFCDPYPSTHWFSHINDSIWAIEGPPSSNFHTVAVLSVFCFFICGTLKNVPFRAFVTLCFCQMGGNDLIMLCY